MVGQRIGPLARLAEWTKAMLYTKAWVPAGMPFELASLIDWLVEAGDPAPAHTLSAAVGYHVPEADVLRSRGLAREAFGAELARLSGAAGQKGCAGIEMVEIPGLVELDEPELESRIREVVLAGLPLVVSWDLLRVPPARLGLLASLLAQSEGAPRGRSKTYRRGPKTVLHLNS